MSKFPRSTSPWLWVMALIALLAVASASVSFMIFGGGIAPSGPSSGLATRIAIATNASTPLPTQSPTRDPVLRLPGFEEFMTKYPTDWEQRLDPSIRPMVEFQRMIGEHGTVVSFADNQVSPSNPNPKVRVFISDWDGTDLFAIGVARTYNGKPVELVPVEGPTKVGD